MIDLMGPAPGFDTPLAMISACHRRIERRLEQLGHAVRWLAEPNPSNHAEALRALGDVCRHFATAGAHHTDDEEQMLFPMLRESGDADLVAALDALEAEHRDLDSLHRDLVSLADRLNSRITPEDLERLRVVASALQSGYARHIQIEDARIMPLAAKTLTPAQIEKLGFDMRRRRGA